MIRNIDRRVLYTQIQRVAEHIELDQKSFFAHRLRVILAELCNVARIRHIDRIADRRVGAAGL